MKTINLLITTLFILIMFTGCCRDNISYDERNNLHQNECESYYNNHTSYTPFSSIVEDKGVFFIDHNSDGLNMYTVDANNIEKVRTLCSSSVGSYGTYDYTSGKVYQIWRVLEQFFGLCDSYFDGYSEYDGRDAYGSFKQSTPITWKEPYWLNPEGSLVKGESETMILHYQDSLYLDQFYHTSWRNTHYLNISEYEGLINIVSSTKLYTYNLDTKTEYLVDLPIELDKSTLMINVSKGHVLLYENCDTVYITDQYGGSWSGPFKVDYACNMVSDADYTIN